MEENIKKYCPNCSQLYLLNLSHSKGHNYPLHLTCGHSMCEKCIGNIIKFGEPIECKICHRDMAVEASNVTLLSENKMKLYELFPVNVHMVGELYLQLMEGKKPEERSSECYLDLKALLKSVDTTEGACVECHGPTTKMCHQCESVLCEPCFNKIHKNFIIFKTHSLKTIGPTSEPNDCKIHKGKPLDYYCNDCKKSVCMDCMMIGANSCKNHDVASVQEINEGLIEDLSTIYPKVDETFRRLTKTAVDIGHLLNNIESETNSSCEYTKTIASIEQHFSKFDAELQKHKMEIINTVLNDKLSEKKSLQTAKMDVADAIIKTKKNLNMLSICTDPQVLQQTNLAVLLTTAKEIINTPWYLKSVEPKYLLKITVKEDFVDTIHNYISFTKDTNRVYKLYSTTELGDDFEIPPAPTLPSYPPELPKDVRQSKKAVVHNTSERQATPQSPHVGFYKNAPQYRSKSGSVSSINSASSESSMSYRSSVNLSDVSQKVQPVMPFAENQHPKHLYEGSQEVIYITHIIDPHNFFVQRACHQELVKEMLREFRNAVSLPKPSISHIAEGKIYLVHSRADNMWQRCRVISIDRKDVNKPILHVFSIDFGSTESVTIEKIRLVPPPRLTAPIPLAINCSLANCEPKTGNWNSDDSILIRDIIDNKQAVMHVRHIRSTSDYTLKYDCDVTTFEDGISLAHALVFHERAKMPNPKLPRPRTLGVQDKPKIYSSTYDLKPQTMEDVYITHIVSPDKFFVRKRHLQDVYDKLSEDLDNEYNVNDNSGTIYLPESGMVCAVNLSKVRGQEAPGTGWARAVVVELPGRSRVRVVLPDSGELLLVHWKALRRLDMRFTTLAALAVECHLAGVTPLNRQWSAGAVALLQRFQARLLAMHVEDNRGKGSLGVTLLDRSDDDEPVCVNTEMINHKFAITFGIFMFNKDNPVENQVITNKSPLDPKPSTSQKKSTTAVTILKKEKPPKTKKNKDDLDAKDKGPLRLEANILHYESPSLLYVSLVPQQKIFSELFEKMRKFYSSAKITPLSMQKTWKVGDRCCTFYSQTESWRRAVIIQIEDTNAKLFFSDFACVDTVPLASLRDLTPDFASMGDAAIKCHLCGVIPVSNEWPSITKEFLKELLDAYRRIFITKLGNFKDNSMPVEIWVYHTIQGDALSPDISEWRCLNKKIIEQGLGIPDASEATSSAVDTGRPDDEMISFLNIQGSVSDWLHFEPLDVEPKSKLENTAPTSPVEDNDREQAEGISDNTLYITDWLPAEPIQYTEFTGVPTYIDNHGHIYLHELAQEDTLDLIRKALDVRFKNPDSRAKYNKWRVGEPCVALYFLDNRFYRGRILEVNHEASNCLIHYVDYGNEEVCSFENIRKSIALHQIPVQAHKCVFSRIKPAGGNWDRQTLDYVHKSVVEKRCFVKITGDPVGDAVPIDLKYDRLWFNDHLVEFEMAVYTDGSKAVVRKFQPVVNVKQVKEDIIVDSGPDFIIEDDITPTPLSSATPDSFNMESMAGKDWNTLMEDEEDSSDYKFIFYPKDIKQTFLCDITIVYDLHELGLLVIHDDESKIVYEELYEDIKKSGGSMSPLDGIYENKACIALFHEDDQWYRASILQYSEDKKQVKVKYVDYGNMGVIPLTDVREIDAEWAKLPPSSITAKLWGVKLIEDISTDVVMKEYSEKLLAKGPFHVKVMEFSDDSMPLVELRNDNGDIINESLIEAGIFLKT